jgi:hypothetical protein
VQNTAVSSMKHRVFHDGTLIGCSLSSVASRNGRGLAQAFRKTRGVAREVNRLLPNRDNARGWAGPRQAMSPLGNGAPMTAILQVCSRPGDELVFADHLTLMRFFSTSSPWSNIIRSVVGANMIVKDVRRTGNAELLQYDDSQRCQIGRAASDRT